MRINKKSNSILKPIYFTLIFFVVFTCIKMLYADKIATTEDGKKVILKDDGTWKYVTSDDSKAQKDASSAKKGDVSTPAKPLSKDISVIASELKSGVTSDFRDVNWGMSLAQVKKIEKLKLLEDGKESLKYDYVLIGMKCNVLYNFKNDKLTKARYTIKQKHHDPALFNEDFIALRKHLRLMYGAPVNVQDIWKNEQLKSDKSKWGFAVSIGFLTRMVIWKTEKTKIVLHMEGQNHEISLTIKYASLK